MQTQATTSAGTSRPAASVITVNFNEKHRLEVYLPSLFASHGDFELIISDNGSQDGSLTFIAQHYPQVRVLENGRDLGFPAGSNRAAPLARASILVFLNPDMSVEKDWLPPLLEPLNDPAVGLVTSKILLMSQPDKINTCGNSVHLTGLTLCRGLGAPRDSFMQTEEVDVISGAAFAIRREIFEQIGGFDEDLFAYLEETDLGLQARLLGWKTIYEPRSVVYHDYTLRFGPLKVFYQERNRYVMLLKNLKWPTLLVLLPSLLLAEVVTWGFVLARDRRNFTNKFKAYWWIPTHWKSIMTKRRKVQAMRKVGDRELLKHTGHAIDFGQVSQGGLGRLAAAVFNPLFYLLRKLTLLLVWW
jgi:hypothetical protein